MSDRERLIDRIINTPKKECCVGGRANGKTYRTAEMIADHILEDGWIRPPCKVGDTVYCIFRNRETLEWYIGEKTVHEIAVHAIGMYIYISPIISYGESDIGVRIFFNEEEAKKALKELEDNA